MKENKPKGSIFRSASSKAAARGRKRRSKRTRRASSTSTSAKGYAAARVGQPELKVLRESKDGSTRWVELRIPVTEGPRYRMGELTFDGNKVVPSQTRCGRSTR